MIHDAVMLLMETVAADAAEKQAAAANEATVRVFKAFMRSPMESRSYRCGGARITREWLSQKTLSEIDVALNRLRCGGEKKARSSVCDG
ncbi:MAG: hypothetical protein K2Q06_07985 [Parvularculaceae bacterium]|nr:hypothetical protein [Parvularculaceae bacterium]